MKRAIVTIHVDILGECLSVMKDHGLSVVSSISTLPDRCIAKFIIEGEALPDECSQLPVPEVTLEVTAETYGRQKMHKISAIKLVGAERLSA